MEETANEEDRISRLPTLDYQSQLILIDNFGPYADIILPGSMNLPQLKGLCLLGLSISNVESAKRLFSSCPVLERLRMVDCNIQTDNQRNLIVDSRSLKRFEYLHCLKRRLRRDDTMVNIIKLCALDLEDFTCGSFFTRDYSLENCSPLSRVNFDMRFQINSEDESAETYSQLPSVEKTVYARRMIKFLATVHMVKELNLSAGFLEVLSQALETSHIQTPHLYNLERLKLDMWFTNGSLRSIAHVLKISPNINTIPLTLKESNLVDVGDSCETGLSFQGMLSHLESVQIKEVEGCDNELKFLELVLRNAVVLKKVVLYPRSTIDSPDRVREQFLDKLRELPRASSHIIMHWPATKEDEPVDLIEYLIQSSRAEVYTSFLLLRSHGVAYP